MSEEPKAGPTRIVPPLEFFEKGDAPKGAHLNPHLINPGQLTTHTYEVNLVPGGGLWSYQTGSKLPVKGLPFREAVFAIDSVKRVIINTAKFLISPPMRYLLPLTFFLPGSWKWKIIESAIVEFGDYTEIIWSRWGMILQFEDGKGNVYGVDSVCPKPSLYCDFVRELYRVGMKMAGENVHHQRLVIAVCMIMEYDDAYRYRIQDGLGEINKEAFLKNPRKEIVRVLKVIQKRDSGGTVPKFGYFVKVAPWLMRVSLIRKAATDFVRELDFEKIKLDKIDMYRCFLWGGYDFGGIPFEQRIAIRLMIDEEWEMQKRNQAKVAETK